MARAAKSWRARPSTARRVNVRSLLPYVCLFAACGNSSQAPPKRYTHFPPSNANCTPGQLGCVCDETGACSGDMYCGDQRTCVLPQQNCNPGEADCACSGGGCNSGLACVNNVCRDNVGFAGGPCLDATHCHTAARCAGDVCVPCSPGEQGCTCSAGGLCNETLSCTDGMCVAGTGYAAAPATATAPACVTPCSGGMVAPDGTWVACPSDGVMDGCLPGLACEQGQCLCSGSKPKSCTADVDCHDFQTCLNGFCRANCALDTDCRSGAVCHRRVCRKACSIGTPDCPSGNVCEPLDGQKGVCLMRADSVISAPASAAVLKLSQTVMRFTPNLTENSFKITNT